MTRKLFTLGGPSDNVDGLVVFGESGKVFDLPIGPITIKLPETNVVVTTSSCQTPFATGFEVSRVDRGVLVVPIDDQRSCFHGRRRS